MARPVPPAISVQVLQEFYVSLLRKKIPVSTAQEVVAGFYLWEIVDNDLSLFKEALQLQDRYQLSFWDAAIVGAAKRSQAKELWSEDLSHGQRYDGVRVVNPLADER